MFRSSLAVLALSLVPLGAQMAFGDTLHGFCVSPATACPENNVGGVTITPTSANPPYFGIGSSGTTEGNFELVLMAPDNAVTPKSYSLIVNGTNVSNASVTSALFQPSPFAAFTSGKLETYLGLSYTPANPISGFLGATQHVDSGATGYYVYLFNFGAETGNPKNDSTAPQFSIASGSVPLGSVFLGLEFNGATDIFSSSANIFGATPPSASILEDGTPNTSVPEPADFALVGLGLLALGCARKRIFSRKS